MDSRENLCTLVGAAGAVRTGEVVFCEGMEGKGAPGPAKGLLVFFLALGTCCFGPKSKI